MLAKELGDYQNHRYLGWFSDYQSLLNGNDGLPFTLLYEVQYEHGASQESFFFKGLIPARLMVREVRVN